MNPNIPQLMKRVAYLIAPQPWHKRLPSSTRHGYHATRALLCAEHGVPNTGRQWVRLRKQLRRPLRACD